MIVTFIVRTAAAAALAVLSAAPACAADARVAIDSFAFSPRELHVAAGTTVTWINRDDTPHTVVDAPAFRSKALDTGDSFAFTFTTPGEYAYFCSLHPHMTGVIVVEADAGPLR